MKRNTCTRKRLNSQEFYRFSMTGTKVHKASFDKTKR